VLFGTEFWGEVLDFAPLVKWGTVSASDLELFFRTDSVDEAFEYITTSLREYFLDATAEANGGAVVEKPV
jgi:hypothetical protein